MQNVDIQKFFQTDNTLAFMSYHLQTDSAQILYHHGKHKCGGDLFCIKSAVCANMAQSTEFGGKFFLTILLTDGSE